MTDVAFLQVGEAWVRADRVEAVSTVEATTETFSPFPGAPGVERTVREKPDPPRYAVRTFSGRYFEAEGTPDDFVDRLLAAYAHLDS